jgi:hypothetical protein
MHLCNSLQLYLVVVILRKSRPADLTNQSDRPLGAAKLLVTMCQKIPWTFAG